MGTCCFTSDKGLIKMVLVMAEVLLIIAVLLILLINIISDK